MTRVATRENESCFLNIARYGTARQLEQVVRWHEDENGEPLSIGRSAGCGLGGGLGSGQRK